MVAGKTVSHDSSAPVKSSKSSSWFSKWPGTIAKKAMEAFKLIEKAVFLDNVEESESNKVQVLEIQVKKLQQKVDELMKLKMAESSSNAVVNSKPVQEESVNRTQVVIDTAPKADVVVKSVDEVVKSNTFVPVKPRPFNAADLMTQKLKKTKAVVNTTNDTAAHITVKLVAQPNAVPVASVPSSAAAQNKMSPVKAVRPPMKPFSSTDLKQIKLNKNKSKPASSSITSAATKEKTPARPLNKPMSMQSALKNAIKKKFSKAKGSPKKGASGSDSSDNENEGEISEW